MNVKSLKLKEFRNYGEFEINFSKGVNVIYGENGCGKTNLIEAMFMCCIGKSFRTNHDTEMINNNATSFNVRIGLDDNYYGVINIIQDKKKGKSISVDGVYLKKISELMGKMNGIMFSPETMSIINDGPAQRRKFLDIALCQLSGEYYYSLVMYNKTLEEKKNLLEKSYGNLDLISLEIYNESLANYGSAILNMRAEFIKKMNLSAEKRNSFITSNEEILKLDYVTFLKGESLYEDDEIVSRETIKKNMLYELQSDRNIKKETDFKKCFIGPHRDDFEIECNGENLKIYGSQGQKKSAVISMKMAELDIMKNETGRTPILFLDDVLSELDVKRRKKIIEMTKEIQAFYTCPDKELAAEVGNDVNYINLEELRAK